MSERADDHKRAANVDHTTFQLATSSRVRKSALVAEDVSGTTNSAIRMGEKT